MLLRLPSHLIRLPGAKTPRKFLCRYLSSPPSDRTGSVVDKPFYVTTPIFYPNAAPHIGHLHSLVIADIIARYQRLLHPLHPVQFLTGADEHGLKIQKAALARGMDEKPFCDELSDQFRKLAEKAQISNSCFMRTTDESHHKAVQDVWRSLDAKGLIYKGSYAGWYSITDECFYTDNQIISTPSPTPNSASTITTSIETGAVVEWSSESNYMFRLSEFRERLLQHYTSSLDSPHPAIFPPQYLDQIIGVLKDQELDDLSISRPRSRLSWGVSVPGDEDHTIYVWFDALLNYLSGLGYPWAGGAQEGFQKGWPVDVQVIGKDILRFHAIYLPAILLALGLPLQKRLLSHAHWTVEQRKMSKSLGNVADPFQAIEEYGVDVVRYYLARVGGRFRDDVDWSQVQLQKYSKEIQSHLGNYLLRTTSARIRTNMALAPPLTLADIAADSQSPNAQLLEATKRLPAEVAECMDKLELADGLDKINDVLRLANKVLTDVAPWTAAASPSTVRACYLVAMETLRVAGICMQPFTPDVAGRLLDALAVKEGERTWADAGIDAELREVKGIKLF